MWVKYSLIESKIFSADSLVFIIFLKLDKIVSLFLTVTNIGIIGRDHKLIEDIHLIL